MWLSDLRSPVCGRRTTCGGSWSRYTGVFVCTPSKMPSFVVETQLPRVQRTAKNQNLLIMEMARRWSGPRARVSTGGGEGRGASTISCCPAESWRISRGSASADAPGNPPCDSYHERHFNRCGTWNALLAYYTHSLTSYCISSVSVVELDACRVGNVFVGLVDE